MSLGPSCVLDEKRIVYAQATRADSILESQHGKYPLAAKGIKPGQNTRDAADLEVSGWDPVMPGSGPAAHLCRVGLRSCDDLSTLVHRKDSPRHENLRLHLGHVSSACRRKLLLRFVLTTIVVSAILMLLLPFLLFVVLLVLISNESGSWSLKTVMVVLWTPRRGR